MKSPDKFLFAIAGGVVVLVVVAFVVVLAQPAPTYQAEDSPAGVVYNYLLALQQRDYERAYALLSPSLRGYPQTIGDFAAALNQSAWQFDDLKKGRISFHVTATEQLDAQQSMVIVSLTRFTGGELFSNNSYTFETHFTVQHEAGAWKLVNADNYWLPCWEKSSPCP